MGWVQDVPLHWSLPRPAWSERLHQRRRAAPLPQNVAVANESGNTALHWACLMGHEQVTRLLMEAGANPSALNKWVLGRWQAVGASPMHGHTAQSLTRTCLRCAGTPPPEVVERWRQCAPLTSTPPAGARPSPPPAPPAGWSRRRWTRR